MRTGNQEATVDESTDPTTARAEGVEGTSASTVAALRPGDQLASSVGTARVVVVRATSGARPVLACGGSPMVPATGTPRSSSSAETELGTLIGKRYVNADETLELLCVNSGVGALSCDGAPMSIKAAKPLPASD